MLEALACRGPDGAGVAMIGPEPDLAPGEAGRSAWREGTSRPLDGWRGWDGSFRWERASAERKRGSLRFRFAPNPVWGRGYREALGPARGAGSSLPGAKARPGETGGITGAARGRLWRVEWTGPLAIGHTRLSTESRIDLSHSQPFWIHGVPDFATVHNGHVTNYHKLRRRDEQRGVVFYTDNDSEVIGVYLRDRMEHGRSLPEASRIRWSTLTGVQLSGGVADGLGSCAIARLQTAGACRDRRLGGRGDRRDRPAPGPPRRL